MGHIGGRNERAQGQMAKDSTHVEDTVRALAELRQEHELKATTLQRVMGRLTEGAASPGFIIFLTAILFFWIVLNSALFFLGIKQSMRRRSSGCRAAYPWRPCT